MDWNGDNGSFLRGYDDHRLRDERQRESCLCGLPDSHYSKFHFLFIATKSLSDDDKKTWVGVLSTLLCGFVGGILYLTWTPTEPKVKKKKPLVEESMNRPSIPDQILELKDLKDMGEISAEEYESRCQSLLKKRSSDDKTQKETAS